MNFQNFIHKHLYKRSLLSYLLLPFSLKYAFLQWLRRQIYRIFPALSYRSRIKVISIGNIVSGGSGKTPFTIFLTKYLSAKGFQIAVSHRGYKGKFEHQNRSISDRERIFDLARDAGDEAFLLAEKLVGIPIIVGKNRKLSIKVLERKFPDLDYIILDDSFQHLKVKHDFDCVVFSETGRIGNGFVLPAGILRESLSALKYADLIVWKGNSAIPTKILKFEKPVIEGIYQIKRFYDSNGNDIGINKLKKSKIALFSGIGQPESFAETVKEAGLNFEKHFRYPDHYEYDNSKIFDEMKIFDFLLTTEKDYSKLQFREFPLEKLVVVEVEFLIKENGLEDLLAQIDS